MPLPQAASAPTAEEKPALFLAPVQTQTLTRGTIAAYFETTARIEAENKVEASAKGSGLCLKVGADIGDSVRKGAVLAELERRELEAQVRQSRVQAEQQKAALEIAEQSLREGIGSSVERDNARFAYEQALASLELTEIQISHQTILSPIQGVITQRHVVEGMSVVPGMPLFKIVDPHSFVLPINVPEKEMSRLRIGQEAEVRIDVLADHVFAAQVSRIYPSIDPASGTVRVVLDFEDTDDDLLREAAFARVRLLTEIREDALLLPRAAILEEEGRRYVFVLREADAAELASKYGVEEAMKDKTVYQALRTEVQTGLEQSDSVEALGGVSEEDTVVVLGQNGLKHEALVWATNLEEEMASKAAVSPEAALEHANRKAAGDMTVQESGDANDAAAL